VSTPLAWDELGADLRSDHYTVENLPRRLAGLEKDPWDGYLNSPQSILSASPQRRKDRAEERRR
jgi:bifunctional non-homologous end joining protein LigD